MRDFVNDMGLSLKMVIGLEETTLARLALIGGIKNNEIKELKSWTGQNAGGIRTVFRNEIYGSRALKNPSVRGCPICLREDAEFSGTNPLERMFMRGDWQLREVSICLKHRQPLIQLWSDQAPTKRFDISSRLTEILTELLAGTLDRACVEPSSYDRWLDHRLETGQDDTWLSDKSIYASTTMCRLLGIELLRLQDPHTIDPFSNVRLAQAAGFEVLSKGQVVVREALYDLAGLGVGSIDEPSKDLGAFYNRLGREYLDDDAFAPFRQTIRDCIVKIWPVAAGDDILGFKQPSRLLHSIKTASSEAGVGAFRLKQFLANAGAIKPDSQRHPSRQTFDAETYAEIIAEVPTLVGPQVMQKAIGATGQQLKSLAEDGILRPRIDIPTIKSPWHVADGLKFIAELNSLSVQIPSDDPKWEGIQDAKKRKLLPVGEIIAAIRSGSIQIGRRNTADGYRGFLVLKREINEISSVIQRSSKGADTGRISAASFGRTVGIRDKGRFLSLIQDGHTPATFIPHPKFGTEHAYVLPGDIEAFHKRFLTPTTMAIEFGEHWRTLVLRLNAAGVMPFAPNGADFGALYLRENVEVVFG